MTTTGAPLICLRGEKAFGLPVIVLGKLNAMLWCRPRLRGRRFRTRVPVNEANPAGEFSLFLGPLTRGPLSTGIGATLFGGDDNDWERFFDSFVLIFLFFFSLSFFSPLDDDEYCLKFFIFRFRSSVLHPLRGNDLIFRWKIPFFNSCIDIKKKKKKLVLFFGMLITDPR